jgi:hypothetical protein
VGRFGHCATATATLDHAWPDAKAAMLHEAREETGLPLYNIEAWAVAVERPMRLWRRLIVESEGVLSALPDELRYHIIEAAFRV